MGGGGGSVGSYTSELLLEETTPKEEGSSFKKSNELCDKRELIFTFFNCNFLFFISFYFLIFTHYLTLG